MVWAVAGEILAGQSPTRGAGHGVVGPGSHKAEIVPRGRFLRAGRERLQRDLPQRRVATVNQGAPETLRGGVSRNAAEGANGGRSEPVSVVKQLGQDAHTPIALDAAECHCQLPTYHGVGLSVQYP